ncbi:SwmB domain-containing protein [Wenyingzhuangia aestuarii]|uniref:SwmB domain-containing protein n=1 Tax=Wenyingzhuangia aestuarii TaxID=1647582 RepID=UPI00143A898A|nr:SwmB domain-containing protein [Wenyingzhuangia aestuarii]NJB81640.1 hypothetical protein [Wenyingzhuangia aestuarii]
MKNKFIQQIILGTLLLCTVVSCTQEYADYTAPDTINDTSWIIGFNPNVNGDDRFSINIDTHISFLDLSQGQKEHRWIIEKGNYFLKERFTASDSLPLFIINNDTVTKNTKAHVFFRKKGYSKIRLFNTYDAPVSNKTSLGTFTSKQVGNLHVIDTTFTFDVYGHIKPDFKILQDGVEKIAITADELTSTKNKDSWPTVEVEAGSSLTYFDQTTEGRPTSRRWEIPNGSPITNNAKEATIKFFKLGTFDAGTITANRGVSNGVNYPSASATKIIPLKVKVIKSSQPFAINGQIKETKDEVLRFQVSGELTPFTSQESFFTVNVTNGAFNQNISVSNAKVSEADATYIELTLSEPIYNSDVITVNYAGGTITSSDERPLEDFTTPITVTPYFEPNVLPGNGWASFETSHPAINNAFALDYFIGNGNKVDGSNTDGYYERTTSKSFLGEASMHFKSTDANPLPGINLWGFAFAKPDPIPAGTYKASYRVFLEPGNTLKAIRTEINKPVFLQQVWDIENVERGSWQLIEKEITFPEDITESNSRWAFRIHPPLNAGVTGAQEMYIDDFSLIKIETRP